MNLKSYITNVIHTVKRGKRGERETASSRRLYRSFSHFMIAHCLNPNAGCVECAFIVIEHAIKTKRTSERERKMGRERNHGH